LPSVGRHAVRTARRSRKNEWVTALLPPLLAFLVAQAVTFLAAVTAGLGSQYFGAQTWARGDSSLYVSIADHGYSLTQCIGPLYPPNSWCGNAGWLPLYPGLMRALGNFGLPHLQGGADISVVLALVMFVLIWQLIGPEWTAKKLLALALAAVFPGQIYYFATFPISLLMVFTLAFLLLLRRRAYTLAGLAGVGAVWSYSTGFLLAPVAIVFTFLFDQAASFGQRLQRAARSAGVVLAGLGFLFVAYQLWVGRWNAWLLVQAKYGHGVQSPLTILHAQFFGAAPGPYGVSNINPSFMFFATKAQTALVLVIVLVLFTFAAFGWRSSLTRIDTLVLIYTLAVWLFPLTQGVNTALFRSEVLLMPCVILARRLPVALQIVLVTSAAIIAFSMALLFFRFDLQ
jgi:hypothetical protein